MTSSSSRGFCCCPWWLWGWIRHWHWSQWWCHWHVYTALIITLMSHFNSSSVNWTASGFSRSSSQQLEPGGSCPLAHEPLTTRMSPDFCDLRRITGSSESDECSETSEMSPCPAQLGRKCPTCLFLQSWHFNFHDIESSFISDWYFNVIITLSYIHFFVRRFWDFLYYHFNKQDGRWAKLSKIKICLDIWNLHVILLNPGQSKCMIF